MKAHIVVGSNFGDEGKGKCVDFLTSFLENSIVVRANGGSQVGHTVVANGNRHVFHHFGSGHYNNVPTYFSKHFITNPIIFLKEFIELGYHKCFVNSNSIVTTPYDMMLNQAQEFSRTNRHGSCGMGIHETILRSEKPNYKITVDDLKKDFKDRFVYLIEEYYIPEFEKRNLEMFPHDMNGMIENFTQDCLGFLNHVEIVEDDILKNFDNVVFENGQGLLLDQDHYFFPHVTHSKTGVKNPSEILKGLDIFAADVYYCTRPYFTRHGAGPLPNEVSGKLFDSIVDETNIPNEFQGTLRFAPFDLNLLKETIENDLRTETSMNFKKNVFVSCLDQIPNGEVFLKTLSEKIEINELFYSIGPDRIHNRKVERILENDV